MVEELYMLETLRDEDRGLCGGLAASRRGAGEKDRLCGGGVPDGVEWTEKRSSPHISPTFALKIGFLVGVYVSPVLRRHVVANCLA